MNYDELLGYYCDHCKRHVPPYELDAIGIVIGKKEWKHTVCGNMSIVRKSKLPPEPETVEDLFDD
jgi:hypothetical protein